MKIKNQMFHNHERYGWMSVVGSCSIKLRPCFFTHFRFFRHFISCTLPTKFQWAQQKWIQKHGESHRYIKKLKSKIHQSRLCVTGLSVNRSTFSRSAINQTLQASDKCFLMVSTPGGQFTSTYSSPIDASRISFVLFRLERIHF